MMMMMMIYCYMFHLTFLILKHDCNFFFFFFFCYTEDLLFFMFGVRLVNSKCSGKGHFCKLRNMLPNHTCFLTWSVQYTVQVGSSVNTSELYCGDTQLESQLAHWLSWLSCFLFSPLHPTRCQVGTWNYPVTTFRSPWFIIHELYCQSTHVVLTV